MGIHTHARLRYYMYTDILINATSYENRIALVENGDLIEFHLERPTDKGLVGNIYRGRVVRVLPGMQAAFVDIGLDRTGFLYVDDVQEPVSNIETRIQGNGNGVKPPGQSAIHYSSATEENGHRLSIEDLLKEDQQILVQIAKEPMGTKGARLTCNITLPCRNLVFMPFTDHIGISRKIENEEVRQQLKEKIEALRPPGTGFIMRTIAENTSRLELEADMEFLLQLWDEIRTKAETAKVPSLIYKDLDIVLRSVRDLLTEEVNELLVDSRYVYERLVTFVKTFAPNLQDKIIYYDNPAPLFEACGIEAEINRALDKKVWLRSGGYLIIETTEALTVIDVNTGRYVGKNDLSETIFQTNMEAVREIAYQLRLRNLGGIIIIDFIDMESEEHREELYNTFKEAMRRDKSRVNILRISEFGLVQMTRKRSSESLNQILCESCFYCNGDGFIKSKKTICYEIFRKITRDAGKIGGDNVTIKVHPEMADLLLTEEARNIKQLEQETRKRFTIIPVSDMHIKRYEVIWSE